MNGELLAETAATPQTQNPISHYFRLHRSTFVLTVSVLPERQTPGENVDKQVTASVP